MGNLLSCVLPAKRPAACGVFPDSDSQRSAHSGRSEAEDPAAAGRLLGPEHAGRIEERYALKSVIGRGSYAVTRLAVERATGRHFAAKSIDKRHLDADERRRVRRELQLILHLAGHPNIVKLEAAVEDDEAVHLVMELCSGGELVDHLVTKGAYTERDAASIMRQVLEAVAFAHDMGCMHRDIKISNILAADKSPGAPVKLVDWGYGAFLAPGKRLRKLCGTCSYLAPEVLAGRYDERADVWSCGVLLYVLLSGRLPFNGASQEEVMELIRSPVRGVPDLSSAPWPSVSAPAKAAVAAMLTRDPAARPSAREALGLAWLAEAGAAADAEVEPEVLHRIHEFAGMNRLKKHAALFIAAHLPPDEVRGLRALFRSIAHGKGAVTARRLHKAMVKRGSRLSLVELEKLLAEADIHGRGALDLPEFVAAELPPCRLEEEANMLLAFQHFDRDGDGAISAPELAAVLAEDGGAAAGPDEALAIIRALDEDGDMAIGWKEFKHMMRAGGNGADPEDALHRRSSCGDYDLY